MQRKESEFAYIDPVNPTGAKERSGTVNYEHVADKPIHEELKELVRLVRLNEQFAAIVAHGAFLPLDQQSRVGHEGRVLRLKELLLKYGLM